VILPGDLEDLVVTITKMFLEKRSPEAIAEATGYPISVINQEISRLKHTRRDLKHRELDQTVSAVIETHLDVIKTNENLVKDGIHVLKLVQTELEEAFSTRNAKDEDEEEAATSIADAMDEGRRKKQKKSFKGMSPLKIESYFNGLDKLGKYLDRAAQLQGLLTPHLPQSASNYFQQNNTNFTFQSDDLNKLADMLLDAGHKRHVIDVSDDAQPV
jgi:hypothetical protein